MREDFLHFVWRMQRFNHQGLTTTTGQTIEIVEHGRYNTNAGPDFLDARVRIDGTLWAGHIEMHLRSGEWLQHNHQHDPAYQNVVLHVVLDENAIIYHHQGERIPCLNIKPYLPVGLARQYLRLLHSDSWIPCQQQLHTVPDLTRSLWLERLLVERLEERTAALRVRLRGNQEDWEQTFFQSLAWGLGLSVNAEPMLQLASSMPMKILLRHRNNLLQLEALLFGQAGMLDGDFADDYPLQLKKEYAFWRHKYQLQPMLRGQWKFMRMRPANFPSIRIAQLAGLLHRTNHLWDKMLAAQNIKEIENALELSLGNYWTTHFRFDKNSAKSSKRLGRATIQLLVINVIAPMLFLYGQERGIEQHCQQALALMEQTPAEENSIIEHWSRLGLFAKTAAQTQGLIQLKNGYCDEKKCLQCAIGCDILKRPAVLEEGEILYLPTWWLEPAAVAMSKGA